MEYPNLLNTTLNNYIETHKDAENHLQNTLSSNKDAIIDSFGGLLNMIQLCLTNANAAQQLDPSKLHTFEKLMNDNKIVGLNSNESNQISKMSTNSGLTEIKKLKIDTLNGYHTSQIIINCCRKDCLLVKCISNLNSNRSGGIRISMSNQYNLKQPLMLHDYN